MGDAAENESKIVVVESILAARRACHRARLAAFGPDRLGLVTIRQEIHEGHLALVRRAREECGVVAVALDRTTTANASRIAVAEMEDPEAEALARAGAHIVLRPLVPVLDEQASTRVVTVEGRLFPAVPETLTYLVTILHVFTPEKFYFGELDAVAFAGLRRAMRDLAMTTQLVPCRTARDGDGLPFGWEIPPFRVRTVQVIPAALDAMRQAIEDGQKGREAVLRAGGQVLKRYPELKVEYLETLDAETLGRVDRVEAGTLVAIAARINGTRLTDAFYSE